MLIESIEAEKVRRIRNGSTKRERAQQLVVQAPDVLGGIMLDASASPKHRIDSAKALDAFAANGPEAAPASDRFQITINLGSDVLHFDKSIAIDANDVDPFNDIDTTPQGLLAAIAANKQRTTAVVSLFERLAKGRPPPTEEAIKQPRRGTDPKSLPNGRSGERTCADNPRPRTRCSARVQQKATLLRQTANEHCLLSKRWESATAAGSGVSHNTQGIPAQQATPDALSSQSSPQSVIGPTVNRLTKISNFQASPKFAVALLMDQQAGAWKAWRARQSDAFPRERRPAESREGQTRAHNQQLPICSLNS